MDPSAQQQDQSSKEEIESTEERNPDISVRDLVESLRNEIKYAVERSNHIPPLQISRRNALSGGGPRCVSIGPLHWSDPSLGTMQDEKLLLINNSSFDNNNELEDLFLELKHLVARTRRSYPTITKMTNDQFVLMLFLDAYFIIDRLTKKHFLQTSQSSSQQPIQIPTSADVFTREYGVRGEKEPAELDVDIDLIMLDNQIPLSVIHHVWTWLTMNVTVFQNLNLFQFLLTYFDVGPRPSNLLRAPTSNSDLYYHHLLQFLYYSMIPERLVPTERLPGRRHWIPSATELKVSGIIFRLNTSPHSILDINFNDGILQIPTIWITESQRIKLENLIDFEQSNRRMVPHFSNFVGFMSCLACDEKDVQIIRRKGIIENRLGSDKEVKKFFQNLNKRCSFWDENTSLGDVCIQINSYHQSWKTIFRRKLCSNPWFTLWFTLSLIGGVGIFILTLLQTFYTMQSYVHPRS